ncbi:hypothetical protein KAR91_13945 [Candidatus Pacearchaeota archaeon]|nr:hypothetical protein [Candidatus Pacearchaeota archaeon]
MRERDKYDPIAELDALDAPDRDPHLTPLAKHHGYIGLALSAVALVVILSARDTWLADAGFVAGIIGVLLVADDLFQHHRQHRHPLYRSPVNRLWGWVLRRVK